MRNHLTSSCSIAFQAVRRFRKWKSERPSVVARCLPADHGQDADATGILRSLMVVLLIAIPTSLFAISPDNSPTSDPSPESELAAFVVHPDFTISLFADESLGIANPIAIQWDPRGRLWVLCTLAYAQLKPGELPNDKLFILSLIHISEPTRPY